MNARALVFVGVLLLGCGSSQRGANDPELEFADPTADERRAIDAFAKLGWAIYQQDTASAIGTDVMMALTRGKPDPRVRGWVTLETSSGYRVQFVAPIDTRLLVVYGVEVPLSGEPRATTLEPPVEASAEAALLFRARKTVIQRGFGACTKRYNFVVLPGALLGERGHLVYALAATTQPTEVVLGGHYRFLVSEDGSTVLKALPLSKGCMTLEASEGNVASIMVSILTPLPNESHFFVSLLHRTPVFVAADGRLWEIDPGGFNKTKN